MAIIPTIKSFFQNIPEPIGNAISKIPYNFRIGIGVPYRKNINAVCSYENMVSNERKKYVLSRIRRLLLQATKIPFYKELYSSHGVNPQDIREFSHIAELPVITKSMLQDVPIEERSSPLQGRYLVNTGGSSGATLSFYILPDHIPVEWAHMHTIWAKFGYKQSALKFGFGGRNLGKDGIKYDGLRHQFTINVYKSYNEISNDIRHIIKTRKIQYLHGYPSALAEFAEFCERSAPDIVEILQKTLKGAFYGSEYPAEVYRNKLETVFSIPTVSWYGHTERCILAWEKNEKYIYHPFQTYGYCEVVPNPDTGGWKLIGTAYDNFASPFIRYDTGDDVEPVEVEDGILKSFRIRSGRLGEFVTDRKGVKIPLTALIYGRHHKLFDIARFIQVQQIKTGEISVIATLKDPHATKIEFKEWFDCSGLDMVITFKAIDKPILSPSGKVLLKVK